MSFPVHVQVVQLAAANPHLLGEAQRAARALYAQAARLAQVSGRPICPDCFAQGVASGWLRAVQTHRLDELATECVRMRGQIAESDQLTALANYEHAARTFEERCRQLEESLAQSQREVFRLQVQENRLHHELRAARDRLAAANAAAEGAVRVVIAGGCDCEAEGPAEADTHPIILPLPARPRGSWLRRALRRLTRKEFSHE